MHGITCVVIHCGTLLLYILTPSRVYLAADSRYSNPPTNTAVKVFYCGRSAVCGISGNLTFSVRRRKTNGRIETGQFDVSNIVADLAARINEPTPEQEITALEVGIYAALKPHFERWFRRSGPMPSDPHAENSLATVLYVHRARDGAVTASQVRILFRQTRNPDGSYAVELLQPINKTRLIKTSEMPLYGTQGFISCVRVPLQKPANISDDAVTRSVETFFADCTTTKECSDVIGGPIDIAAISPTGRTWVRRKTVTRR